ncbi:hypothetical protein RIF29_05143 [Crotalaria pallida]|uniref:Uncharacterized protein n=1 Tax=Crotalaria pallida TaxID=3830 RepID=A0AAN9J205_CROPI
MSSGARNDRIELGGLCSPPESPSFTFGLDISLRKLRLKLLQDQVGVSVINVTGSGGSGKSTLAKMLCRDDQVKGDGKTMQKNLLQKIQMKAIIRYTSKFDKYVELDKIVDVVFELLDQAPNPAIKKSSVMPRAINMHSMLLRSH